MAVPVNPKYPLVIKELLNRKCECNEENNNQQININYPIINIDDINTIDAQPSTFYNIRNSINKNIVINCDFQKIAPTRTFFTYDGWDSDDFGQYLAYVGIDIIKDNTMSGYNYKSIINISSVTNQLTIIPIYLTNDIVQGGNSVIYANILGQEIILPLNNINIIENKNTDIKEYVFNINTPTNLIFNNIISWNNNDIPDLSQEGICTISIVNGVGCYTFVKVT